MALRQLNPANSDTDTQTKPSIPNTQSPEHRHITHLRHHPPHKGRVGPPPYKEVAMTSNTAIQQRKRNLPTHLQLFIDYYEVWF